MGTKTSKFITRAEKLHNHKYDYSLTYYVHCNEKVTIICPIHGPFLKSPARHLNSKQGCQKCTKKHKPTTEEFIQKAQLKYGTKYDYSLVEYITNKTKIKIICPVHGIFETTPITHLYTTKNGCGLCANILQGSYHKLNTIQFIEQAKEIHGNKYDYSLVEYKNYNTNVKLICPIHGIFEQSAGGHITNQSGCPLCVVHIGGYGIQRFINNPSLKTKPGNLYIIKCQDNNELFLKIGITIKDIKIRFNCYRVMPYTFSVLILKEGLMFDIFTLEQQLKKQFYQFKYRPKIKFSGHTECFAEDIEQQLLRSIKSI